MSAAQRPGQFVERPLAVLLDIEGTICPISFVKDTLFPYSSKYLHENCAAKWNDEEFQSYVNQFPPEAQESPEALIAHTDELTQKDVKAGYFKALQGYTWKEGYESGAYASPLFPDVIPFLIDRATAGIKIAIFSSGSVPAQKLLMKHARMADSGPTVDTNGLLADYFDTINAGSKSEKESYIKIAESLGVQTPFIHFFTDIVKEADAAVEAGMKAFIFKREGNAPLSEDDEARWKDRMISSFTEVTYF